MRSFLLRLPRANLSVINHPFSGRVIVKDPLGIPSTDIPLNTDSSIFQLNRPVTNLRAFIESDAFSVLGTCSDHNRLHAGPDHCSETHRAWLAARDQLHAGKSGGTEIVVTQLLMGEDDRDDLRVGDRAIRRNDEIDSRRDQCASGQVKNRRAKWSTCSVFHVEPRQLDGESHPLLGRSGSDAGDLEMGLEPPR